MSDVFTTPRVETPFQQVDRKMAEYREVAERREQFLRLARNADFRKPILEFYIVTEAARLVQMSAQLGLSPQDRADALAMAQATGHLKRFLDVVDRQGEQAVAELSQYTEHYAELVAEEET